MRLIAVFKLLLFTKCLYQSLVYSQSLVIPEESRCLTAEQRINALRQIRGYVNRFLDGQEFKAIATVVPECEEGLWHWVAYLNMTDPSQRCPPSWREYNISGVRACVRPHSTRDCHATFHNANHPYCTAGCVEELLDSNLELLMPSIPLVLNRSPWMV